LFLRLRERRVAIQVPQRDARRSALRERHRARRAGKPEAPRPRASRVHDEQVPILDEQRLMRVADHQHVGAAARDRGRKPRVLPVVRDQDLRAGHVELQELRQREQPRAVVVVAPHGVDRRDLSQQLQQRLVDGVAREHDAFDAAQDLRQERVETAVQV
jgi:hypothetical protein